MRRRSPRDLWSGPACAVPCENAAGMVTTAAMRPLAMAILLALAAAKKRPPLPKLPTLPPMRTCAAGSPAAGLAFCEQGRSHEERAGLLAATLTQEGHAQAKLRGGGA